MVTIFFSDIVRFTDISRALSPVKVCNMLDRLYLAFDDLANKHEVFKVETIGDAWMGVTNCEFFISLFNHLHNFLILKCALSHTLSGVCDLLSVQWKATKKSLMPSVLLNLLLMQSKPLERFWLMRMTPKLAMSTFVLVSTQAQSSAM